MTKENLSEAELAARQETRRKAREAARADGKDWKSLSKEERKAYRLQAKGKEPRVSGA